MQKGLSTQVYVVSHKDFTVPNMPGYVPILAGAVNNKASIEIKDNTGINISEKNPQFCELTAQYWVWKNALNASDNIGFVHYRRYFYTSARKQHIVPAEQFSKDLEQYDVILPEPWVLTKTIGQQFAQFHNIDDLKIVRSILLEKYPAYITSFDTLMRQHSLCCYNMFVMSNHMFNDYMTWLFDVLQEAEKRIDMSSYDQYNQRLFGFLAERLLNVWVRTNNKTVKYYPVFMPDAVWWKETLWSRIKSLVFEHRLGTPA